MIIREQYTPVPIAANSTTTITNNSMGGFFCTASGTLTLTTVAANGKAATTLLSALSVSAGTYYPLPVYLGAQGATITTASSAAGLLLV